MHSAPIVCPLAGDEGRPCVRTRPRPRPRPRLRLCFCFVLRGELKPWPDLLCSTLLCSARLQPIVPCPGCVLPTRALSSVAASLCMRKRWMVQDVQRAIDRSIDQLRSAKRPENRNAMHIAGWSQGQ